MGDVRQPLWGKGQRLISQRVLFADDGWARAWDVCRQYQALLANQKWAWEKVKVKLRKDVRRCCLSPSSWSGLRRSLLMKVQLVEKYLTKKGYHWQSNWPLHSPIPKNLESTQLLKILQEWCVRWSVFRCGYAHWHTQQTSWCWVGSDSAPGIQ